MLSIAPGYEGGGMPYCCLRIAAAAALLTVSAGAAAEEIGSVDTAWKLLGPDHKVVIEAFDDPDIPGAACWISRARTGGLKGRSEEHTSELQSLMRTSYAVFCLKKKNNNTKT